MKKKTNGTLLRPRVIPAGNPEAIGKDRLTWRKQPLYIEGVFNLGEMEDRQLSITEICKHLGVSNDTVFKWIDNHGNQNTVSGL